MSQRVLRNSTCSATCSLFTCATMSIQEAMNVLLSWLPYTAKKSMGMVSKTDNTCPTLSPLLEHPRLRKLAENEDVKPVLGAARMLSKDSALPDDHLVCFYDDLCAPRLWSNPCNDDTVQCCNSAPRSPLHCTCDHGNHGKLFACTMLNCISCLLHVYGLSTSESPHIAVA